MATTFDYSGAPRVVTIVNTATADPNYVENAMSPVTNADKPIGIIWPTFEERTVPRSNAVNIQPYKQNFVFHLEAGDTLKLDAATSAEVMYYKALEGRFPQLTVTIA